MPSRSSRARGLKLRPVVAIAEVAEVALFASAWIETLQRIPAIRLRCRRALRERVD